MARGMTAPEARPVTDLLRAVRARVWKQGAIDLLATALWPSGVLTLALGLVHVSATDLPATGALLAGGLPIALAGLWGLLFRRPLLTSAAGTADRVFAAKSLLTSALDVLGHPAAHPAPAAAEVLRQAFAAAPGWRREVPRRLPLRVSHAAVVPVVLGLVGGFLLTSFGASTSADLIVATPPPASLAPPVPAPGQDDPRPAHDRSTDTAAEPATGRGAGRPPGAGPEARETGEGPAGTATPSPRAPHHRDSAAGREGVPPAGGVEETAAEVPGAPAATEPAPPPPGQTGAGSVPGTGERPGTAASQAWEPATDGVYPGPRTDHVDLPRAGDPSRYGALAPGPGGEGSDLVAKGETPTPGAVPPAVPPPEVSAAPPGRLALRGYVSSYLQRLQDDPP